MPEFDNLKEPPPLPPDPRIEAKRKADEEAEALRRIQTAAAEAQRKADEESAARRRAEDEAARHKAEIEAIRRKANEEAARRDEEVAKLRAQQQTQAAEAQRRADEEAARRRAQQQAQASSYTPSYSSSSSSYSSSYSGSESYDDKRGAFLSIVFGLVCGIGAAFTIGWICIQITGIYPFPVMVFLVLMVVCFIVTFIAWRNRKNKLFLILLALCIPGWLAVFGIIPERPVRAERAAVESQASASATVTTHVNFRSGPSTDHDIIRQLQQGETVMLTGETQGGWIQVSHNSDIGWVSSEFLE